MAWPADRHSRSGSFFDAGVIVTVNTDDPKMFNTSLEDEYEALATHLGFTWTELTTLNDYALGDGYPG